MYLTTRCLHHATSYTPHQITVVEPGALDGLHILRMNGNPTLCSVDLPAGHALACRCAAGHVGDGSFCSEQLRFVDVCVVKSEGRTVMADCANKGLTVPPVGVPVDTTLLDLSNNHLAYLGMS